MGTAATLNVQSTYDLSRDTGTCNSIWLDNKKLQKSNHKALLIKEIFDYIKWWIIVLGASPCKIVFIIIKDVFIFHCPVGALKRMFLLSSTQPGSDTVFTFKTLLGTKRLTYPKFTKDLKWLLKQLGLGTGYITNNFTVLGEEGQVLAPDWHSQWDDKINGGLEVW